MANIMAIVHLLNTVADVYLWFIDKIKDEELNNRIKERKKLRNKYIIEENQRMRLEILRDLGRNDPKP